MNSDLTWKMHERESKRNRLYKPGPNQCSVQNETTVKGKPRKVQLKISFGSMILEFIGKAGKQGSNLCSASGMETQK